MWYITYKENDKEIIVNKLFNTKRDAYVYSSVQNLNIKNMDILNCDTNISVPDFKVGSKLYFKSIRGGELYGCIDKINNYLITINQEGNLIELSKARINKEYLNGNLTIQNQ